MAAGAPGRAGWPAKMRVKITSAPAPQTPLTEAKKQSAVAGVCWQPLLVSAFPYRDMQTSRRRLRFGFWSVSHQCKTVSCPTGLK